jgi:hypothetical protein
VEPAVGPKQGPAADVRRSRLSPEARRWSGRHSRGPPRKRRRAPALAFAQMRAPESRSAARLLGTTGERGVGPCVDDRNPSSMQARGGYEGGLLELVQGGRAGLDRRRARSRSECGCGRMSRLTPRHRDTSPGGSYGTPGAEPPRKARVCRRSAAGGSCYETGGSSDDARAVSAAVTKRLGRTPWSSSSSKPSITSSATSRPAAGASVTAECMTAM